MFRKPGDISERLRDVWIASVQVKKTERWERLSPTTQAKVTALAESAFNLSKQVAREMMENAPRESAMGLE